MIEKRYSHSGEDIVIQHQEEPTDTKYGNHSVWFDDGTTSIHLRSAYKNKNEFPNWLQREMSDRLVDSSVDELQRVVEFLAQESLLVCKCGRLFPKENAVSTGFAGVKCGVCSNDDSNCPETEDNNHNMEIISGRNNALKPTKKRCTECGYESQTPPTG